MDLRFFKLQYVYVHKSTNFQQEEVRRRHFHIPEPHTLCASFLFRIQSFAVLVHWPEITPVRGLAPAAAAPQPIIGPIFKLL